MEVKDMFKSTKEFDKAVYDILVYIRDSKNLQVLEQKYGEENFGEALARCCDVSYIVGIKYDRTADGNPHFSTIKPMITYTGLEFVERYN